MAINGPSTTTGQNNGILEKALKGVDEDDRQKVEEIINKLQSQDLSKEDLAKSIIKGIKEKYADDTELVQIVEQNLKSLNQSVSKLQELVGEKSTDSLTGGAGSDKLESAEAVPKTLPKPLEDFFAGIKDFKVRKEMKSTLMTMVEAKDEKDLLKGFAELMKSPDAQDQVQFILKHLEGVKKEKKVTEESKDKVEVRGKKAEERDSENKERDSENKERDSENKERDSENKETSKKGLDTIKQKVAKGQFTLQEMNDFKSGIKEFPEYAGSAEVKNVLAKMAQAEAAMELMMKAAGGSAPKGAGQAPQSGGGLEQAARPQSSAGQPRQHQNLKNNMSAGGTPPQNEVAPADEVSTLKTIGQGTPININAKTPSKMYSAVISSLQHAYESNRLSAATYQSALGSLGIKKQITTKNHKALPRNAGELSKEVQYGRTRTTTQMVKERVWENGKLVEKMVEKTTTEQVPYTKSDPLRMPNGLEAYADGTNSTGMLVKVPGTSGKYSVKVPYGATYEDMQRKVNYAQIIQAASDAGGLQTSLFTNEGRMSGGGMVLVAKEDDVNHASQLTTDLMPGVAMNTEILSKPDLEILKERMAFFVAPLSPGKTTARGSQDSARVNKSMRDLGLMEGGRVIWSRMEKATALIKGYTPTKAKGKGKSRHEWLAKEMQKKYPEFFSKEKTESPQ